ncbi:glutathione S-transferase family protein [Aquabacterium sp. OR-4]|uniref:glutathione S-transferase family protein n=1 Tax=Aquabacterium sp. OR-4 TaxID=2978127 RepID=UPI0021B289B6|nr:glutathione S-transferase family protein [Aquabacterium sp. OR-4]MDT7834855.1 glutathione S-transferase family protein [Aquabacterium sp. OR-4]
MRHELILHHYPMSPFAEKARLLLGAKGLAWRSVIIPSVMPKPDVLALTGGYRKTPLLQIGADVYCDTALMARVLEARQPTPSLYPASAPLAAPLAQWADYTLFWLAATVAMQPAGAAAILPNPTPETVKAFRSDRAAFTAGMARPTLADATVQLQAALAALDAQLARGTPWLLGAERSIADFSVAHCLWFVRRAGPVAEILAPHAALNAWLDSMLAIGHGTHQDLASSEAVAMAAAAGGHAPTTVQPGLGFEPGQAVTVAAVDYGTDPVAGTLVGLGPESVTIARRDERAGAVHVHFPRQGFQIRKEQSA